MRLLVQVSIFSLLLVACSSSLKLNSEQQRYVGQLKKIHEDFKKRPKGSVQLYRNGRKIPVGSIQEAFDQVQSNDQVLLSEGVFLVRGALKLPKAKVLVRGAGKNTFVMAEDCESSKGSQSCTEKDWFLGSLEITSMGADTNTVFANLSLFNSRGPVSDYEYLLQSQVKGLHLVNVLVTGGSVSTDGFVLASQNNMSGEKFNEKTETMSEDKLFPILQKEYHSKAIYGSTRVLTQTGLEEKREVIRVAYPESIISGTELDKILDLATQELKKNRPLGALYLISYLERLDKNFSEQTLSLKKTISEAIARDYGCSIKLEAVKKEGKYVDAFRRNMFMRGISEKSPEYALFALLSTTFGKSANCQLTFKMEKNAQLSSKKKMGYIELNKQDFYKDQLCLSRQAKRSRQKAQEDAAIAKYWGGIASSMRVFRETTEAVESATALNRHARRANLTAGRGSKGNKSITRYLNSYTSQYHARSKPLPSYAYDSNGQAKSNYVAIVSKEVSKDYAKKLRQSYSVKPKNFRTGRGYEKLYERLHWGNPEYCTMKHVPLNHFSVKHWYRRDATLSYSFDGGTSQTVPLPKPECQATQDIYQEVYGPRDRAKGRWNNFDVKSLCIGQELAKIGYDRFVNEKKERLHEQFRTSNSTKSRFESILGLALLGDSQLSELSPNWLQENPFDEKIKGSPANITGYVLDLANQRL